MKEDNSSAQEACFCNINFRSFSNQTPYFFVDYRTNKLRLESRNAGPPFFRMKFAPVFFNTTASADYPHFMRRT
ncbi:hypothetical protein CWM47_35625 [Spirosoma pollinicola]|uniref:Uncharacterized protein n=1 Tax=Spirosoma pollinicola TaxID=2057025 RepID=A0A2K8ZA16_9BACT|nr:hypothetical protein CWM47_35625 [Spirosoma pollinicola]